MGERAGLLILCGYVMNCVATVIAGTVAWFAATVGNDPRGLGRDLDVRAALARGELKVARHDRGAHDFVA